METLQELREKYNKLDRERDIIYNKILELEDQEMLKKFTVGECYLDTWNDNFNKIIAIDGKEFYCINVNGDFIRREFVTLESIRGWRKITSEQFKVAYLAVIKDIQDPDLEDKEESNWDTVYNSIINSINTK
jgi:hypothetical protein